MEHSIQKLRSRRVALGSIGLLATALLASHQDAHAQVFDDAHPSIQYLGNWFTVGGTGYEGTYNGRIHLTNTAGSSVRFTFTGRTITYLHSKAFNRGSYQVLIDGQVVEPGRPAYSQQTLRQVGRTWRVGGVPAVHTIEVKLLAANIPQAANHLEADAFVVDIPSAPEGTTTDDASPLVYYYGDWAHQTGVPGAYAGTNSYSGQVGAFARFAFEGDKLRYNFSGAPNRGVAVVTIDGELKGKIDLYAATLQRQKSISFAGLGTQPHVVHIAVSGEKNDSASHPFVDIDSFDAIQTAGSVQYFRQTHRTLDYTDGQGTVPGTLTNYHVVQVNVDDPFVTVYPQGANNAVPGPSYPPFWIPSGDNRQRINEMYFASPAQHKRVLISTDYFCDQYAEACGYGDPGAPLGPFMRDRRLYNPALTGFRSAVLFELRRALIGKSPTDAVYNAVGGGPKVLSGGVIGCEGLQEGLSDRCGTLAGPAELVFQRRNGACVSHDRRMLYLIATDGRSKTTWRNIASYMQSLGCSNGMQLVGGAATGLVVDGAVVVEPDAPIGTGLIISNSQPCTGGLCFTSTPELRPDSKE